VKFAVIYVKDSVFYICSVSKTADGVLVTGGECYPAAGAEGNEVLGGTVRRALDASRTGIPHPASWTRLNGLQAAGAKNWKAFADGLACIHVELANAYTFIPTKNRGRYGFEFLASRSMTTPANSYDAAIGAVVKNVLPFCVIEEGEIFDERM
jgi:hypothetical protein